MGQFFHIQWVLGCSIPFMMNITSAHLILVVYGTMFPYTTFFYIYNYFFPHLTEISEIWIIPTIVYDVQELYYINNSMKAEMALNLEQEVKGVTLHLASLKMLVVLELSGPLCLYSGTTMVGRLKTPPSPSSTTNPTPFSHSTSKFKSSPLVWTVSLDL